MNATIRTRTGRLHLAYYSGTVGAWFASCTSVILHTTELRPAVSPSELVGMDDTVCTYCLAIGRAVLFAEQLALEREQDATVTALAVGVRHTR